MSATGWAEPAATPSQPVGKGLFTSGATVTINAPTSVVFDAITGFSSYTDWNTWTPMFTFQEADRDITAGAEGRLKTVMKAQNREYDIPIEVCIFHYGEREAK
jgi:hypothetical protein